MSILHRDFRVDVRHSRCGWVLAEKRSVRSVREALFEDGYLSKSAVIVPWSERQGWMLVPVNSAFMRARERSVYGEFRSERYASSPDMGMEYIPSVPLPTPEVRMCDKDVPGSFTFVDLFAGIGGFRLALEELGGRCLLSCELDVEARQTYCRNFLGEECFPGWHHGNYVGAQYRHLNHRTRQEEWFINDVTRLEGRFLRGHVDILTGGFPCQSFSTLGRQDGTDCLATGGLFYHLRRAIFEIMPKAFLLENVEGLMKLDGGRLLQSFISELEGDEVSGQIYTVSHRIVDASAAVPQRRKRLYFVGIRTDLDFR